jgi:hypothetical protein
LAATSGAIRITSGSVATSDQLVNQLPGFQSGTWLVGEDDGKGLSLTLWDTNENAQTMADRFGIGSNPTEQAFVARCEIREVAATA